MIPTTPEDALSLLSPRKTRLHSRQNSSFTPPLAPQIRTSNLHGRQMSRSKRDYSNNKENVVISSSVTSSSASPQKPSLTRSNASVSSITEKRLSSAELIDNVFHKYEVKEQLGRGAFAFVYRATNRVTKKDIAIKQIDLNTEDDIVELMSEINLLKGLKHPNIVKYHGFIQKNRTLNIFLEYCDGGSLRDLYKKIKKFNKETNRVTQSLLTESEIIFYVKQVLAGLKYLHNEGVVHRDIKAANILLTSDKIVKLADFGVSTKINVNTVKLKDCPVVGTPNWMAPEVITLDGVSTASDIWSLGATIIELYTGSPPYCDLNSMAALHAIVSDDYPDIPDTLSSQAKSFILECFQKDPKKRLSAEELLHHSWLNNSGKVPSGEKLSKYGLKSDVRAVSFSSIDNFDNPKHRSSRSHRSSSSMRHHSSSTSSTPVKQRDVSQASSYLSKYIEKDYESDDWDKDFEDLKIDESHFTKKFSTGELPILKLKKSGNNKNGSK